MTVEQLYNQIGGDYADMRRRIPMDDFIKRFLTKFLEDTSCHMLIEAWKAGDEKAAFEAAHRAKGVCANLSLTRLAQLSDVICEALRPGNDELRASTDVDALVTELEGCYTAAIAAIRESC